MDRIESLERFAHGQAHWIDDLHGQVSELHGEPAPSSVLLSSSLGSEEEVTNYEAEAEEEAEVRTLVEVPAFQEVEGPACTTPLHWGQIPVFQARTSQIHCRYMDNLPTIYPPSTSQINSEFFQPIFLQCSGCRKWSLHSQCS
jgi:hypothetical protein